MRRAALLVTLLVLAAAATGCSAPAVAVPAGPVEATVTITGGRVEGVGPRLEVPRSATLRLTVRSDRADELHVHGYDRTVLLTPDAPATLELAADVPGVFEIELHGAGTVVTSLQVR